MKKHALRFSASLLASALIVPLGSSIAFAQAASDKAAVDNSAQNQRDRDHQTLTPIDQSNKPADLETTRNIRKALVKDDQLSTEAKNIKIITVDGAVGAPAGALVGFGIPEYEAKQYEGKVKNGNILISVHTDDSKQRQKAKEIFERAHAEDISATGEARV